MEKHSFSIPLPGTGGRILTDRSRRTHRRTHRRSRPNRHRSRHRSRRPTRQRSRRRSYPSHRPSFPSRRRSPPSRCPNHPIHRQNHRSCPNHRSCVFHWSRSTYPRFLRSRHLKFRMCPMLRSHCLRSRLHRNRRCYPDSFSSCWSTYRTFPMCPMLRTNRSCPNRLIRRLFPRTMCHRWNSARRQRRSITRKPEVQSKLYSCHAPINRFSGNGT